MLAWIIILAIALTPVAVAGIMIRIFIWAAKGVKDVDDKTAEEMTNSAFFMIHDAK